MKTFRGFCCELINVMTKEQLLAVIEKEFENVTIIGNESWKTLARIVSLNMCEIFEQFNR